MSADNQSLCELANHLHLTILTYRRAEVDTNWRGEVCGAPFSYLYYVVGGSAVIETNEGVLPLSAGNWYLLPSGCSFRYRCDRRLDHVYFHLTLSGVEQLDLLSQCTHPLKLSFEGIPDLVFDCLQGKGDVLSALSIKNFVSRVLLSGLSEHTVTLHPRTLSPVILAAVEYINSNLTAKLKTTEVADHCFVSKSTLTKHFQKELSVSVQQYLYDSLLSEASRILLKENLSMLALSERLGFSDQFYFARRFKAKYGVSPSKYKKIFS
ncbi:MAG: helix-turn-helix transcriptional regulator [Oscillospiraceae bacterium]|nr:helix-turn-helix transcriptional regulator [Oscillospiraceae bacterium]